MQVPHPNRTDQVPENHVSVCADCGRTFRPRRQEEDYLELCDECFAAEFEPSRHLTHWQDQRKLRRAAHF